MQPFGFVLAAFALVLALVAATAWSRRQRALSLLYADEGATLAFAGDAGAETALSLWLARAGYRAPNAASVFVAATLAAAIFGVIAGQFYRQTVQSTLVSQVAGVPGGIGDLLAETLNRGSWVVFVLAGLAPMSIVRARRRARVRAVEQDLPLALEMLATMADAGLGFDAALTNIVRSRGSERPLMSEFVKFQLDMLAGVPRGQALRLLARRVQVPSLSGFASALIQAEQVGASIAETLQHQAADLRQRRREEALLQAQALPVKLVLPLVICFLPGVFLSTLAPVLFQMLQVANSVLRSGQ